MIKPLELVSYGDPIQVSLRKSARAKNIIIRINQSKVELVCPVYESSNRAIDFLYSNEQNIRAKLKLRPPIEVKDDVIPILGEDYHLMYLNQRGLLPIEMSDGLIKIYLNQHKALIPYLKQYILKKINILLEGLAFKYHFKYRKVAVKDLKSRWGSCSASGDLSFNWRIIFAPNHVLEYLVIHEFCHLKEMNHGRGFWNLVQQMMPGYKLSRMWLKKNGSGLYDYLKS